MDLRKIDALVAEHVMGWHRACGAWIGPNGLSTSYGFEEDAKDFCPSTDIAAAWEVVEQIREILSDPTIFISSVFGGWCVELRRWGSARADVETRETAPLAICLAALKAKGIAVS